MDLARREEYAIFTKDLDFGIILARSRTERPSVIQVRASENILPEDIAPQVLRAFEEARGELEAGALVTIDPRRHRVRLLPF